MASVQDLRKRAAGYEGGRPWRARYRDLSGREHARHFARKADAERWLNSVTAGFVRGDYVDPRGGRVTFSKWSEEYFACARHKRATTLARDVDVTNRYLLPDLGSQQLARISPLDIGHLVDKLEDRLAPATVHTIFGVLRVILNAAVAAELIAKNPCPSVRLRPKPRTRIRFLTADELTRLAEETPVAYRVAIYLAGVLGLRRSEVFGLRVGRIDFLRRTLAVVETLAEVHGIQSFADVKSPASRRTLRIPPFLVAMLAEHLRREGRTDPEALVFEAPEGGPVRMANFRTRVFRPAAKRAGFPDVTFHALRHSAVGLMIAAGAHIEAIKQRMGHSSIRVTSDVYGSLLPSVDESVSDGLENLFTATRALGRGQSVGRSFHVFE